MAITPSTPPTDRPMPNPHKYPLRALIYILHLYLPLNGPAWLRGPRDFRPLAHIAWHIGYFLTESYTSTLMCFLIPMFLLMTDRQLKRKERVYGGRLFANYFTPDDLKQQPADRDKLQMLTSDALFHLLYHELRLLVRLLREARRVFRLAPLSEDWLPIHKAVVVVLLRIAQISAVLRKRGSHYFAEECLRYQARVVWRELFGGVPAPEPARKWLEPVKQIKPWQQRRATRHLLREQAAGHPIPAPFVERFPAWAAEWQDYLARKQERGRAW